jgi:hypothetical protein
MGNQEDYEGIVAEIARYLVGFVAWWVLLTFKSLLVFGGPSVIVSLVILPFLKNPWGDWNGLSIAVFLTCAFGWILAWLWLIVRPLVNSILPYGRTVERILADRVTGFARRGRRQGALPGPRTRT